MKRESATQTLGFASRPFVLCGLPIRRPAKGELLNERRNGQFLLQVTGNPTNGLPWGQDRLVPIFLATLVIRQQTQTISFRSTAKMLDVLGMQQGSSPYRRLIASFQRVFGATIFFGTDTQSERRDDSSFAIQLYARSPHLVFAGPGTRDLTKCISKRNRAERRIFTGSHYPFDPN